MRVLIDHFFGEIRYVEKGQKHLIPNMRVLIYHFFGEIRYGEKGQKHALLVCKPIGASVIDGLSLPSDGLDIHS